MQTTVPACLYRPEESPILEYDTPATLGVSFRQPLSLFRRACWLLQAASQAQKNQMNLFLVQFHSNKLADAHVLFQVHQKGNVYKKRPAPIITTPRNFCTMTPLRRDSLITTGTKMLKSSVIKNTNKYSIPLRATTSFSDPKKIA